MTTPILFSSRVASGRVPVVMAIIAAGGFSWAPSASAQVVYSESFPYSGAGNIALETVGWTAAVSNNPARLYGFTENPTDGAVYAYEGAPGTSAFYTTEFAAIEPTGGLEFSLSVQQGWQYTLSTVEVRFAAQVGGAWYATEAVLAVPSADFTTQSWTFSTAAAAWRDLTITGTTVSLGGATATDLAGPITGAGVVVGHLVLASGGATVNFDNFAITAAVPEPGTYAAWLGGAALGCVAVRRIRRR